MNNYEFFIKNNYTKKVILHRIWFSVAQMFNGDEKGTPVKNRDCTRSCNPGPQGLRQS